MIVVIFYHRANLLSPVHIASLPASMAAYIGHSFKTNALRIMAKFRL